MRRALVLIDFQNEWVTPDSDDYLGDIGPLLTNANKLLDHCRDAGYKIIFTQHNEEEGEAFKAGSERGALIPTLHFKNGDTIITKNRISPFYKTTMERVLQHTEEVVVCGILTNLCVRSFIEGAYDRDHKVTVITDCCTSYDAQSHKFTIKDLKETREEVDFIEVDDFIRGK